VFYVFKGRSWVREVADLSVLKGKSEVVRLP